MLCVVVIDGGVAKGVRIVVEKEHGDFGFVEMVTVVDQSKCEECILVGEEKDLNARMKVWDMAPLCWSWLMALQRSSSEL